MPIYSKYTSLFNSHLITGWQVGFLKGPPAISVVLPSQSVREPSSSSRLAPMLEKQKPMLGRQKSNWKPKSRRRDNSKENCGHR